MLKIGCCGYPVNTRKYQETFTVVELNSTFYKYPRPQTAKRWRETALNGFEFTVKVHQDITHKYRMTLERTSESINTIKVICNILDAKVILFQTPASYGPDRIQEAAKFFEHLSRDDLTVVWEPRGPLWQKPEILEKLKTVLERIDVSHVTDPFLAMPVYTGKVAYFRLHGHGERMYYYQYSNDELRSLREKMRRLETSGKQVYVFFNNLTMFQDAQRFLSFVKSGVFQKLETSNRETLEKVLKRIRYPTTKNTLISQIGWRLIELEDQRQVRMAKLFRKLVYEVYSSPEAIVSELGL